MNKEFEGKVTYDKTDSTGDPFLDNEYCVGGSSIPDLKDLLRNYEGRQINLKIIIEEVESTAEDVIEYCETCRDPLTDEDDVYEGVCNSCGDGN